MKTTLKQNDALRTLALSASLSTSEAEKQILQRMEENQLLTGNVEDIGMSILEVINLNGYDSQDAMNILFPTQRKNQEIMQLLDSIIIWGDAVNNPCPECGCELLAEDYGHGKHNWTNYECENENCGHAQTNEPDWDSAKGGKDYGN